MGRDSREVATTSQEKIRRTWSGERGGGGKRRREPSPSSPFASPSRFSHQFLRSLHINRELSKDVLEQSTSTGSEAFSFLICLDATRFVVLSVFTHIRRFAKKLGKNTAQECKTSSSGWHASLKNGFAWTPYYLGAWNRLNSVGQLFEQGLVSV